MAKHREVFEDDYPTGPIDVWPLLAADAPPDVLIDDKGNHHGRAGRFVKKAVNGFLRYRPTLAEVQTWDLGPEASNPHVTIWDWPDDPSQTTETHGWGAVTTPAGAVSHKVTPPKRERPILPDDSVIRAWAQRQGYPVGAKGKVSQAVKDAYLRHQQ